MLRKIFVLNDNYSMMIILNLNIPINYLNREDNIDMRVKRAK